eukprot:jgi/Pico_ML_1/51912/g2705.t1
MADEAHDLQPGGMGPSSEKEVAEAIMSEQVTFSCDECYVYKQSIYVLRVEDTSDGRTRHAFLGIGFRHRPHSSDFSAAMYEHRRFLQKKAEAEKMAEAWEVQETALSGGLQHPWFHHREREQHHGVHAEAVRHQDDGLFVGRGGIMDIPPPPRSTSAPTPAAEATEGEDLDFGDFVSS